MTYVNIFLASSLDDLAGDREAIGNYIRWLNKIYEPRGVRFELYECEQDSIAMSKKRKQEEYNKKILDSQLFMAMFFNKAGKYTLEEFDIAYRCFEETDAPAIITFFRQGEGYAPEQSVLDFMKRLDEELGHYFKKYTHIDSLKFWLLMQLKLMNLDVSVEVENSRIMVGGQEALTLENIPMWSKNANFQQLKAEYEALEKARLDAKAAAKDPILDPAFLAINEKWKAAKEALRQLEQDIFAIALKAEEKSREGNLTARQRKAYELMEQGDSEGANRILDLHEILDDAAHVEALAEQTEKKLEQYVQELLQKIEILKTQTDNTNRFDEINRIFEHAVALEERRNLKKTAMQKYVAYLWDQKDYKIAIPLAERYLKYMELQGQNDDIANAADQLGVLYSHTNRMKEAKAEYLRAKEIYEQLAAENPSAYLPDLAVSCNNLGALHRNTNQLREAEEEHLRAKEIREQLAAENPSAYMFDLAGTYYNLSLLYMTLKDIEQAVEYFCKAKEGFVQAEKGNPACEKYV